MFWFSKIRFYKTAIPKNHGTKPLTVFDQKASLKFIGGEVSFITNTLFPSPN